jgi:hypothetical protein
MTSKRTGDRYRGVRPRHELRDLDSYPERTPLAEADLFRGYPVRIAQEPEKRPLTPVYDESGLAYGEPISKGRTDLQEGKET